MLKRHFLSAVVAMTACLASAARAGLTVNDLRCEYRTNPMGVDTDRPRFSWLLKADRNGERPTAYQILVASTQDKLNREEADAWDIGRRNSDDTIQIEYAGKPLIPRARYWWKARSWDANGQPSRWSDPATFTMGVTDTWRAKWIGLEKPTPATAPALTPTTGSTTTPTSTHAGFGLPMPIFRREFEVTKPIRRAVAFASGMGQFELRINGRKAGDEVLEPGWTNYRKTCLYSTHDITALLQPGRNAIGVLLGNGMFHVERPPGRFAKFVGSFGPQPVLTAELFIEYADGSTDTIITDDTWKAARGPIVFSSAYGGEDHDARLEQPGWDRPSFDDSKWSKVHILDGPGGKLTGISSAALPVRVDRILKAVNTLDPRPGTKVFDLGQNCSLIPIITVRGPRGSRVKITPGELLTRDNTVEQQWARRGQCTFEYTLKGDGPETWSPHFTYYGSRYFMVESAGGAEILDCAARFITGAEPAGEFTCSNGLFNRTASLIDWAIRSNTVSVFTDCPHREKLGWLEQIHLMGPSLAHSHFVAPGFAKMSRDMAEAQLDTGLVPNIAPEYTEFKGPFRDSPEWGSAAVMAPWQLYEWYGDTPALRDSYPMMKRYADYLGSTAKEGIVSHGLGDWYDLGPGKPGPAQLTPIPLTATAFYYWDLRVMEKAANVLGKSDDAAAWAKRATEVAEAFNRTFYASEHKTYATGSQCANAVPVVLGLVPPADVTAVVDKIVADVAKNSLTAGDVGYRFLVRALADHGRSDALFALNNQTEQPGYGYMLAKGATSLAESWNAREGASQNHFMLGHLHEWFYGDLLGIQNAPGSVAFKRVHIRPTIAGDLTWAKGKHRSIRGDIVVHWNRDGDTVRLTVDLPVGVTGTVHVPGEQTPREITSGRHEFTGKLAK